MGIPLIVFYDYICPFCFVGIQTINKLVKQYDIDVVWKGYELHPETPLEGIEYSNAEREARKVMWSRIEELATMYGIIVNQPTKRSNSKFALAASEYALEKKGFSSFQDGLFKAYFQLNQDLGDLKTIQKISDTSGFDIDKVMSMLEKQVYEKRVIQNRSEAFLYNYHGQRIVPTYVIAKKITLIGVQPYSIFEEKIKEVLKCESTDRTET